MNQLKKLFLAALFFVSMHAQGKPSVVVTTYPLYTVMEQVGGDTVKLDKVIPYGSDIHTFRPSPKTMVAISRASLFVYSGAGLEPWSEQLLTNVSSATEVLDMSRYVMLIDHRGGEVDAEHEETADEHEEHGHEKDHDDEAHEHEHTHEGHDHGAIDPHYWLKIDNMIAMTRTSVEALTRLQPHLKTTYESNAAAFISSLKTLKSQYRTTLGSCRQKHLVCNHNAFGYLAHDYDFEVIAVTGLSPDQQPSAKAMAKVVKLVRNEGVKTVFFEAFVSDSVARALARESGASVSSLQPLANLSADEAASKENYITIMRKNLAKIAEALECH